MHSLNAGQRRTQNAAATPDASQTASITMIHLLLICTVVLFTSTLSGAMGMAGGLVLMAVLLALLPVPGAMLLHGVTQAMANGARAWLLRKHIAWRVMPPYIAGAALATTAFVALRVVPDTNVVLILVGSFPWVARLLPGLGGLDVTRPWTAAICGALVTPAQLLAGASGPLLDTFYVRAKLDRHQIVASKAITQAFGHIVKSGYYLTLFTSAATAGLSLQTIGGALVAAWVGTRLGTALLARVSDGQFRTASQAIILTVGAVCIAKGGYALLTGG